MGKLQRRVADELTLYVRHMAWLHATPKPPAESKRPALPGTRLERMGGVAPMPPNPMPHVIERLIEIGMSEAAGMGVVTLSWLTIGAWQTITGVTLSPWEARLIRSLSAAYLAEGRQAEIETCPPPWRAPITDRAKAAEIAALDLVLG